MFRLKVNIRIEQKTGSRTGVLDFDFMTEFNSEDGWRDLTNKGRLVLPKNLYYRDETGTPQPLKGSKVAINGLILRGDKVTISAGYKYFDNSKKEVTEMSTFFEGWVSKVYSRIPIELELEDNMWKLKQIPVPNHVFNSSDTLEDMLKFMLSGTDFTVKAITSTTFGGFIIGNESVAQVLQRLQKTYGFESYFRGNELRCGVLIYIEREAVTEKFKFQQNIISEDGLEYSRKDDIVLSAVAYNTLTEETGATTKDGSRKTKTRRLEVLVTIKNDKQTYKVIGQGDTVPENIEGERRTLFFPGAKTAEELADLAFNELKMYYYTGLKGKFTTFGIPFIRMGDNAEIEDKYLPERNGIYKIKHVEYRGGVNIGLRQTVTLDYKINV